MAGGRNGGGWAVSGWCGPLRPWRLYVRCLPALKRSLRPMTLDTYTSVVAAGASEKIPDIPDPQHNAKHALLREFLNA